MADYAELQQSESVVLKQGVIEKKACGCEKFKAEVFVGSHVVKVM